MGIVGACGVLRNLPTLTEQAESNNSPDGSIALERIGTHGFFLDRISLLAL